MEAICAHWDIERDLCYRCRKTARCERAHIIDRSDSGLDGVQNLVPLCYRCHREMPPFWNGEEYKALLWLSTTDELEYLGKLVKTARALKPRAYLDVLLGRMTVHEFVYLDVAWDRMVA